ncbi:hypothetical protein [Methylocaldum sp. 14B]|uniref:hypothetical protein n=1 Tax=Methylocaldum sp. 14B TaxID=1912213 RepID=UPI00098B3920|nr:hypothetical protein [Methylocaldum sp. 14B]
MNTEHTLTDLPEEQLILLAHQALLELAQRGLRTLPLPEQARISERLSRGHTLRCGWDFGNAAGAFYTASGNERHHVMSVGLGESAAPPGMPLN